MFNTGDILIQTNLIKTLSGFETLNIPISTKWIVYNVTDKYYYIQVIEGDFENLFKVCFKREVENNFKKLIK